MEEHEELVLSSLSMLNNLTFYATEESVVFERQTEVTNCEYHTLSLRYVHGRSILWSKLQSYCWFS